MPRIINTVTAMHLQLSGDQYRLEYDPDEWIAMTNLPEQIRNKVFVQGLKASGLEVPDDAELQWWTGVTTNTAFLPPDYHIRHDPENGMFWCGTTYRPTLEGIVEWCWCDFTGYHGTPPTPIRIEKFTEAGHDNS